MRDDLHLFVTDSVKKQRVYYAAYLANLVLKNLPFGGGSLGQSGCDNGVCCAGLQGENDGVRVHRKLVSLGFQ